MPLAPRVGIVLAPAAHWRVLLAGTLEQHGDPALCLLPHRRHPSLHPRSFGGCGNGKRSAPRVRRALSLKGMVGRLRMWVKRYDLPSRGGLSWSDHAPASLAASTTGTRIARLRQ